MLQPDHHTRIRQAVRATAGAILASSLLAFLVGTLLPAEAVGWTREHVPLLARVWDGLNDSFPMLNPLHVVCYAWLAMLWWLVAGTPHRGIGLFALAALSALSETLQILVPGRTALVADALNDFFGIGLGAMLGIASLTLVRKAVEPGPNSGKARPHAPNHEAQS